MDAEIKVKWLTALRSGEYPQGKGQLRSDEGFCCLGVLAEACQLPRWNGSEFEAVAESSSVEPARLPKDIAELVGILYNRSVDRSADYPCDDLLMAMNDSGRTFSEIADYIEKEL